MHSFDFLKRDNDTGERRPHRFRFLLWLFGALVLFAALVGVFLAFTADDLVWDLESAQVQVAHEDYAGALVTLDDARIKAGRIDAALKIAAPFERLPFIGARVAAGRETVSGGILALESASELVAVLDRLKVELASDPRTENAGLQSFITFPPDVKRRLLARLHDESARFRRAREKAADADTILARHDSVSPRALRGIRDKLSQFTEAVRIASPLGELLPGLLGVPNAAHYLVVLENSDEIRPAGGFIGNYILYHGVDGSFTFSEVKDVYALDLPTEKLITDPAPLPMQKYLLQKNLQFRDANWSPDWPTSAQTLLDLYRREGGEDARKINGVIAVTSKVATRLSELVGCITIETSQFCPDNFVDELQYQVEKGFDAKGVPYAQRKDILKPLMREFIARLVALPSAKYGQVFRIAEQSLDEKDIQMWYADPQMERVAEEARWAGVLAIPTPDGFMVADANLGGRKTDPFVKRTIRYSIDPEDGGFTGRIGITYENTAPAETWKTTTYRTYTRLSLPPGSSWLETLGSLEHDRANNPKFLEGKTDLTVENGLAVFGAFTAVEIGATRTLTFRFRLAPSVAESIRNGTYALTVLRQPGAQTHALTLDLDFGKNSRYLESTDLRVDRLFSP